MKSSPASPEEQIISQNLSFIYESEYRAQRDEIDAILGKSDKKNFNSPQLDRHKALNRVNLSIKKGEFIALVGNTGSGKSTLVRTFNGLIPSFYRGIFFGYVGVLGKDTIQEKISSLSQDVGLVFQNPENQLVAMTVEREVAFGLENLEVPRDLIHKKVTETLNYLEIAHLRTRHPYELSGGEQQRVAIASILILEPNIIILDEPTASLDPQAAHSVLNLLKKLNQEKNITIIIIEHRLEVILPYCTHIVVMNEGTIVTQGPTQQILASDALYTTAVRIPDFIELFRTLRTLGYSSYLIPTSIDQAASQLKEILL